MDDTRDIAIKADASAASAHHRLDKMNGSIDRLGESHEQMREDFAEANLAVVRMGHATNVEVAAIKTTLGNALKVAAILCSLAIAITAGIAVYAVTHMHHTPSPPLPASHAN